MYSEKTFKNYIFWLQVRRVFLIIFFSCFGAGLGIVIGLFLKGTLQVDMYNNAIIICLTLMFFLFSLLITTGTGREIQDGYWKIALLRKLTAIQKTLEESNEIIENKDNSKLEEMKKMNKGILEELKCLKPEKKEKEEESELEYFEPEIVEKKEKTKIRVPIKK